MTHDTRIQSLENQVRNLSSSIQTMLENSISLYDTPGSAVLAKAYGGVSGAGDARRLNQLESRLSKMEAELESVGEELGEAVVTFSDARQALARRANRRASTYSLRPQAGLHVGPPPRASWDVLSAQYMTPPPTV